MKSFDLGTYLKKARESKGLSQRDVAEKLGHKSAQSISDWERNRGSTLPSNAFIKLIAMYGLSAAEAYQILVEYELAKTRQRLDREVLSQLKKVL